MIALLLLLFIGSVGGFLAGIMGVGGGLVFIPVLTYIFGQFEVLSHTEIVRFTLANSIALVFISGLSGIFRQHKMGIYKPIDSLAVGIPGALSAATVSYAIQQGEWYNHTRFSWVFLVFLILSIGNMLFKTEKPSEQKESLPDANRFKKLLVGVLAGSVVSLSGLGGGIVMVPLFRMLLKLPVKKATGLSLSVVPLLAVVPIIQYLTISNAPPLDPKGFSWIFNISLMQTNYLVWVFFIPMAIGVMFFSSFGQKTAKKISARTIQIIFATLSIIILIKTLYEIY